MSNEEKLQELLNEKRRIDREIKLITHSGRLCDFVSEKPIEFIRANDLKTPKYSHEHREAWTLIAKLSKRIFLEQTDHTNSLFAPMSSRRFKDFTIDDMKEAGELAEELVKVYNKHFMKHNPTVEIFGEDVRVTDYE